MSGFASSGKAVGRALGAGVAALLTTISSAQTAVAVKPGASLDVHGVAIGMTPAQAQVAIAKAGLPARESAEGIPQRVGFGIERVRPNKQDDLIFVSTMVSRAPQSGPDPRVQHQLAVAFTPERGAERVWAVGMRQVYGTGRMPSVANTVAALREKYGEPAWTTDMSQAGFLPGVARDRRVFAATFLWYWNAAGAKGPRTLYETCRQGLHNTYLINQINDLSMSTVNTAMEKPSWFRAPVAAGCAKVIRAQFDWDADGTTKSLQVEIVDLASGGSAGARLAQEVARREAQASAGRATDAAKVRPVL